METKKYKQKRPNGINKNLYIFENSKERISIEKYMGLWIFFSCIYGESENITKTRIFKTKSEVNAYLKAYMRKEY